MEAIHTQADDLPRVGRPHNPVPSLNPEAVLAWGIFDVVCELAEALVVNGIVQAPVLEANMRHREAICREQKGNVAALPAQALAEIAALWSKPRQMAFPPDAAVVPFKRAATTKAGVESEPTGDRKGDT